VSKKIYVGNLPFSATETQIREIFSQHGEVHSVNIVTDRETGRARGFGFVEMDQDGAGKAIAALDQYEMDGRSLKVNETKPRENRSSGPRW